MLPIKKRARKLWRATPLCLSSFVLAGQFGRKKTIVFDNMHFSFTRLKSSFVSMLTSWAGFKVEEDTLVRILVYSLGFASVWEVPLVPFFCIG